MRISFRTSFRQIDEKINRNRDSIEVQLKQDRDDEWITIAKQIGYFGSYKNSIYKGLDKRFGNGNWRLAWQVGERFLPFEKAAEEYGEAYYQHLLKNSDIVNYLVTHAKDVYDNAETNVDSGFDYTHQENGSTHLQDIAIRRAIAKMGKSFYGNELIEIRPKSKDLVGRQLSPGTVPFHKPELILPTDVTIKRWWQEGSTEAFYQNNKCLQAKMAVALQ